MPNETYFVFDGKLCKAEGMSKEQIFNAIAEATGTTPTDVDEGFISTIVETNRSRSVHIWKGTADEYNHLSEHDPNTCYFIENYMDVIEGEITTLRIDVDTINNETLADSGWIEIKKNNKQGIPTVIGHYRTIGKTVYYRFNFDASSFSMTESGYGLLIELPVAISTNNRPIKFTFFNHFNGTYFLDYAVVMENGKDVYFQQLTGETLGTINFDFSWTIA